MPESNQCFTPSTTPRTVKRPRENTPPDMNNALTGDMSSEKVGDLTQGQLVDCLSKLLDLKLDQKFAQLATKEDLANLTGQVSALKAENEALREEVQSLKRHEDKIVSKLIDLESRSRRNNLIFKGLRWGKDTTNFCQVVAKFCVEVLGCDEKVWVNRAHPLGRGNAIIAHLPSDADIEFIMGRTSRLRNTGYVVHRDYPQEIREQRAHLSAVRAEVERVAGRRKMPLAFNHLTVEGSRFTWQGGKLRAGLEDGGQRLEKLFRHDFKMFLTQLTEEGPWQWRARQQNNQPEQSAPTPALPRPAAAAQLLPVVSSASQVSSGPSTS